MPTSIFPMESRDSRCSILCTPCSRISGPTVRRNISLPKESLLSGLRMAFLLFSRWHIWIWPSLLDDSSFAPCKQLHWHEVCRALIRAETLPRKWREAGDEWKSDQDALTGTGSCGFFLSRVWIE